MSLDVALRHRFPAADLDLAFTAPPGVTALFGPSGAGKTSVANAVAGLLRPDAGHVRLNGRTLFEDGTWTPPHLRRVGYVFQEARLFPHLTVRRNLLYGAPDDRGLAHIADLLDIAPLLPRRPANLSGGERQRVAIGRALLQAPDLLILDEPLSALDAARKDDILPYLERLAAEASIPMLYVSHSLAEVIRLASHVALIANGRLAGFGRPEDVFSDPLLAAHLGPRAAGAVVSGDVTAQDPDGLAVIATPMGDLVLPLPVAVGQPARLRIMAEDVIIARARPEGLSALNVLPARVLDLHAQGATVMVRLTCGGDQLLLARITRRSATALDLAPGTPVHAILKSAALVVQS
ncbi:molybdenum ABC transporter ATP-binding protein [Falsirhodobacter sp. 20TX0035]|uniref:molybdenum ABC transporter ATP-binding protein n=1 Tax=Falsirhodobacter sp. 20TX0035 TaxID=3022019 RepID=UPI002330B86B|nr:molybdenum ABC transporter ATP-binding protein [Falsirhodobacter sp. 20TX0035]MDB6453298.1 molybdenum ABC transporter ATP-binding protein [Falsirhodobacter sp. 20TX0035]